MTFKKLARLVPHVLPVAGCILVSAAAFTFALWSGLLVAGIGCWLIEVNVEAERRRR